MAADVEEITVIIERSAYAARPVMYIDNEAILAGAGKRISAPHA